MLCCSRPPSFWVAKHRHQHQHRRRRTETDEPSAPLHRARFFGSPFSGPLCLLLSAKKFRVVRHEPPPRRIILANQSVCSKAVGEMRVPQVGAPQKSGRFLAGRTRGVGGLQITKSSSLTFVTPSVTPFCNTSAEFTIISPLLISTTFLCINTTFHLCSKLELRQQMHGYCTLKQLPLSAMVTLTSNSYLMSRSHSDHRDNNWG